MGKLTIGNYTGCIIGGAIGDAMGAPTEFYSLREILKRWGDEGVNSYVERPDGKGEITDDTQMLLFTAEGLLRAKNRAVSKGIGGALIQICHNSYMRWLQTQRDWYAPKVQGNTESDGWLIKQQDLFKRRAPGNTCLSALRSGKYGRIDQPINNSKGCGGIMRIAPVGLFVHYNFDEAFRLGAEIAAITHGHPSGYLSAGALSAIICMLNNNIPLPEAINRTMGILKKWAHHEETLSAIQKAVEFSKNTQPTYENVQLLGGGWIGEEALSIALYCSLQYEHDFEKAINLAINHSGDSDSTGSITGNIVGLINGEEAIPKALIDNLLLEDVIRQIAIDLHIECKGNGHEVYDKEWDEKYPGW